MNKQHDTTLETRLNAVADAWAPAVKAACACEPSPGLLAHIRQQAARELAAARRRRLFVRLRPLLVSAAAAALVCTVTFFTLRPVPAPPRAAPLHPATALDGILLLAETAAYNPEESPADVESNPSDAERRALRLLEVQGFVDSESELLLSYL